MSQASRRGSWCPVLRAQTETDGGLGHDALALAERESADDHHDAAAAVAAVRPPGTPVALSLGWAPAFDQWGSPPPRACWLPLSSPVCPSSCSDLPVTQQRTDSTLRKETLNTTLTRTQPLLHKPSTLVLARLSLTLSLATDLPRSQITSSIVGTP